ncbi:MAG: glycosyltransferase [Anaerolineae bacterium]|nr:glycosyltransferase [Anaerolineae bacterium]
MERRSVTSSAPSGSGRKRILFLTPQVPYPPEQGAAIRNYNLIAHISRRHDVALLSFREGEADEDQAEDPLGAMCAPCRTVSAPVRTRAERLRALVTSGLPDMALRLFSSEFAEALRQLVTAERYDLVQIEGIEMAPYGLMIQEWLGPDAPAVIYDAHNAEYLLQKRAFATDLWRPRRWGTAAYSFMQWQRLRRYERLICERAAAVVSVSEADALALGRLHRGLRPLVVPNGVDTTRYHPGLADTLPLEHPAIVFTGKMDFRPNVDAMLWFFRRVWPLVRRQSPEARLYVVGKSPHAALAALQTAPGVHVTGYVEEILPYFGGGDVYIVPLRIGGGTRLKVLEAMAAGLPLVTTSLGAEGIAITPGVNARVADTPEAFAQAILDLLADPGQGRALGAAARRFALEHYDWHTIAPPLEALYSALTAASS